MNNSYFHLSTPAERPCGCMSYHVDLILVLLPLGHAKGVLHQKENSHISYLVSSFLALIIYRIIEVTRMPEVPTFSTQTCRAYMFATIVCAFRCHYSILDLVYVASRIIIDDLKAPAPAFRAFLVCHFCTSFLALRTLPSSTISRRTSSIVPPIQDSYTCRAASSRTRLRRP